MYCSNNAVPSKSLAMGYIPQQSFKDIYPIDEGFYAATLFKELNKPFERGCYRA